MDLVVDASVVVKWFVDEPGSDRALLLRDDFIAEDVQLHVPSHLPYEILNALRFNPDIAEDRALQAALALERYGFVTHDLRGELARRALHIAFSEDLSVYDAAYLALAQDLGVKLVTADDSLHKAAEGIALDLSDYESMAEP